MSERIKHKIRCLLELAKQSQFPNEAQAAKTQALTLMRRHNLSEKDLHSAPVRKAPVPEQDYVNLLIEILKYKKYIEELEKAEARQAAHKTHLHKQFLIRATVVAVGWLVFAGIIILMVVKG